MLCLGAAVVVAFASIAGCTSRSLSSGDEASALTVGGVGALPGSTLAAPPTVAVVTVSLPNAVVVGPIGSRVAGNRVIVIGDSIMASISHRYGDQACLALVPLGWQVEVDAETGRFIQFGHKVLDKRLSAGWDTAVILLGNNYLYNKAQYQAQLHLLLARLVPRPTVLLTTTLFRPAQSNVNSAITAEAALFPNVTVIDWAATTQDTGLTGEDGLHLTERGRVKLGSQIAAALGPATGTEGKCMKTSFRDDSLGSPTGSNGSTGSVPKPQTGSTTTSAPTSTTTTNSVGTATTTTTTKPPVTTTTTNTTTTKPPVATTTVAPTTTLTPGA